MSVYHVYEVHVRGLVYFEFETDRIGSSMRLSLVWTLTLAKNIHDGVGVVRPNGNIYWSPARRSSSYVWKESQQVCTGTLDRAPISSNGVILAASSETSRSSAECLIFWAFGYQRQVYHTECIDGSAG